MPSSSSHTQHSPSFWRTQGFFWLLLLCLLIVFLGAVSSILLPFVLGMIIAYCFDPFADRLERAGLSRNSATALITGVIFSVIALGLIWLLPLLAKQLIGLIALLPEAISHLEHYAQQLGKHYFGLENGAFPVLGELTAHPDSKESALKLSQHLFGTGQLLVKEILSSGAAVLNMLSLLFITPIVSFYALRDWDKMVAHLDRLIPRAYQQVVREQCQAIDRTLSGFLRGQLNVMLILMVYYSLLLSIIGIPFALVISVITGLFIIIPYIGTILSVGLAVAAALVDTGIGTEIYLVLLTFFLGHLLEQQFLTPRIVGGEVGLSPLWMVFAMLSGAALFGFVGMLIAVPAAAVIGVFVRFAITIYLQSGYYNDARRATVHHRPPTE